MPRSRANKPLIDREYRYYVQVYPPNPNPSKLTRALLNIPYGSTVKNTKSGDRVHLETRDKARADKIFDFIRKPFLCGDSVECKRRVKLAKQLLDTNSLEFDSIVLDTQMDDHGAYLAEWLEDNHPEMLAEMDRDLDEDRHHLNKVDSALTNLCDLEREDLLAEHAHEVIANIDDETRESLYQELAESLGKNGQPKESGPKPSKEKLSNCLEVFDKQTKKDKLDPRYAKQIRRTFEDFVEYCDDCPVNRLNKKLIVGWEDHLSDIRSNQGARWWKQKTQPISRILILSNKRTEWDFPDGLAGWLDVWEQEHYKPKKVKSLTVDQYKAMLAKAEEWANIDIEEYANARPMNGANEGMVKANNIKQANRVKREGTQYAAILRIACQCGMDNVDFERLEPRHIIASDAPKGLTLFNLPRQKPARKVGEIDRRTPLLPSTIAAIKRWQEYPQRKSIPQIFSNDHGNPFSNCGVAEGFERLRDACGIADDVTFKRLRKIGGTVGRNNRIPSDEREAFLGHTVKGMCRFYQDDALDDYLVPLVNLIGAEYFDGEKVAK